MRKRTLYLVIFLISIFWINSIYAEEIKYNFDIGAVYSYEYNRQDNSVVKIFTGINKSSSNNQKTNFAIKVVGFQDNAFILDIGNEFNTTRRYLSKNGIIKGAPAEERSNFPFFLNFPEGDWAVGTTVNQKNEVFALGKRIPVNWEITLKSIDKERNLAEISFVASYNLPEEKIYSRNLTLNGMMIFNMAGGVIHQANWKTTYLSKLICKENAITRDLWSFQKQISHSLRMTGVEK